MHEQRYIWDGTGCGRPGGGGSGSVRSAPSAPGARGRERAWRGPSPAPPEPPVCGARAGRGARTEGFLRCCVRAPGASPNMGCSLCSLQKREEHYRLLYEVRQVSVRRSVASGAALTWPSGAEPASGLCAFWLLRGSPLSLFHPPPPPAVALGCLCLNMETGGQQTCHRLLTTDRSPECQPVPAGFCPCCALRPRVARRLGSRGRRSGARAPGQAPHGPLRHLSPRAGGRSRGLSSAAGGFRVVTNSTGFQSRLNGTFKV